MDTGTLILFTLPLKRMRIPRKKAVKIYRELYGYNNSSEYGKYHTRVPGMLDRKGYIRYTKGVVLLRKGDEVEIIDFLRKNKAEVRQWKVILSEEEKMALEKQGKPRA
ncbi:MAG: hypothetical protein M1595_03500 [Candidatus Thermoplasmatota archaeon]|jgi:hypothetical protein|nr:hypothetical protein [Candidatus Thermoplasmatota archaeon]